MEFKCLPMSVLPRWCLDYSRRSYVEKTFTETMSQPLFRCSYFLMSVIRLKHLNNSQNSYHHREAVAQSVQVDY